MKPLRAIGIYLAFVFIGGALLAPWLFWAVESMGNHSSAMAKLADNPFPRFVNRCWLVLALAGLWPFLRALGVRAARDVGIVQPRGHWHLLGWGFFAGFSSLAMAAVLAVATGARQWNSKLTAGGVLEDFFTAVIAAVVVATLEEILFRGALFGALRKEYKWPIALVLSSALYGAVHFLHKTEAPPTIEWTSGLALLPRMLRGFGEWRELFPGFLNLTLAGLILGIGYHRTRNLWFSIGLHGGWIFWLKFYRAVTKGGENTFWGSSKLIDGWASGIVLSLTLMLVWKCLPAAKNTDEGTPKAEPEKLA